ncbi:MAG: sulfatase-like hydrolase/transferase [Polyangiales bacterium]
MRLRRELMFVWGVMACARGESPSPQGHPEAPFAAPEGPARRFGGRRGRAPGRLHPPAPAPAPAAPVTPAPVGDRSRPNILVVLADDQRADAARCMPRLNAWLGARGTTFTHHFASTPLCCPARSTILTGLYPRHHGVLHNGDIEDPGDQDVTEGLSGASLFRARGNEGRTVATALRGGGYRTAFFGKYLNAYDRLIASEGPYVPPGWDEWHAFAHAEYFNFSLVERAVGEAAARLNFYPSAAPARTAAATRGCRQAERLGGRCVPAQGEGYSTDVLAGQLRGFIQRAARDRTPFFAVLAVKSPHGPFESPARYQPDPDEAVFTPAAERELATCPFFDPAWRNDAINEADVSDKPAWIRRLGEGRTAQRLIRTRRQQLVSMLAVEDAMEGVRATLRESGAEGNTVVVFLGDNGFSWGEHRYSAKNCAYEPCVRVPLTVLDPRHPTRGRSVDALTVDVDIAPTLAALAGVPMPEARDGLSLAPITSGAADSVGRDAVFLSCWGRGPNPRGNPDTVSAVRTERWKLIEHFATERADTLSEWELYDLARDPLELQNLVAPLTPTLDLRALSPVDRAEVAQLRGRLDAWRTEATPPAPPPLVPPPPPDRPAPGRVRSMTPRGPATRLEQLIGDLDVTLDARGNAAPTAARTEARFGVAGTDLGYSFEHDGRLWFLFGDTRITPQDRGAPDTVAFTNAQRPPFGAQLGFVTGADGRSPWVFAPPGVSSGGSEVPASGISVDGVAYVPSRPTRAPRPRDRSVLTRWDPARRQIDVLRDFSRVAEGGHFLKSAFALAPAGTPGLPTAEAAVLAWGTGAYRESAVYLQVIRARTLGERTPDAWFFAGTAPAGAPRWSRAESDAQPVIPYDRAGDVSVTRVPALDAWVALYDRREGAGVALAWSETPWGPWRDGGTVLDPVPLRGVLLWDPQQPNAPLRPGPLMNRRLEADGGARTTRGGAYAPYVIERFTRVEPAPDGETLVLRFVLSTWNPYVVHLMETRVRVTRG